MLTKATQSNTKRAEKGLNGVSAGLHAAFSPSLFLGLIPFPQLPLPNPSPFDIIAQLVMKTTTININIMPAKTIISGLVDLLNGEEEGEGEEERRRRRSRQRAGKAS